MTKSEEIALFSTLLAQVPKESYLADYLAGAVEQFATLIRLDMAIPHAETLTDATKELDTTNKAIMDSMVKLDSIKNEVKRKERERDQMKSECNSLRSKLEKILENF